MIPDANFDPPFDVTRASHIVLTTRDLARSTAFYTGVIGLVVTAEADGVAWYNAVARINGPLKVANEPWFQKI